MTDNEKAATFIGWKPDQPCQHRELNPVEMWGNGIRACFGCGCLIPVNQAHCTHIDKAPFMGIPENYMRTVEHSRVQWRISLSKNGIHYACGRADSDFFSMGETAVQALAALYDHEQLK